MQLKVGQRLRCAGSPAEVIVIRSGAGEVDLTCGGTAMVAAAGADAAAGQDAAAGPRLQTGKRYVSADGGLELLCVKGGAGELAADGVSLSQKEAKPLPSSD